MIKYYAWWSDIGEIRLPAIQSSFIILLKTLSIKVWLRLVNLVGEVMLGTRLVEYMMSRKSETFLFESHFRRSILKSPSNITSLFSLINFSERGLRYPSLNSLCCIHHIQTQAHSLVESLRKFLSVADLIVDGHNTYQQSQCSPQNISNSYPEYTRL